MDRLKEKRLAKGYTQIDLAKLVGVSVMSIQLWEKGGMNPTPANKAKLLKYLGGDENE